MKFEVKMLEKTSISELYNFLRLRSEVFIVEQNCAYQDLDNLDDRCLHVLGKTNGMILAYARILPPDLYYKEASIGRVVTSKKIRMDGYGKQLMHFTLNETLRRFGFPVRIMAQCYLTKFYEDFGFEKEGQEFLEDGIPHIEMVLREENTNLDTL